ncbi:interleukin-1 beta-like [Leptodactylus fuscus]|uniref:interleukin-1 beta-like n=1 Tax=Leptodactylus fuscus TaxID=238119 RepID=UPI003F4E5258
MRSLPISTKKQFTICFITMFIGLGENSGKNSPKPATFPVKYYTHPEILVVCLCEKEGSRRHFHCLEIRRLLELVRLKTDTTMQEVPELSDLSMDISKNDEEFYANDVSDTMKANKYSHSHERLLNIRPEIRKSQSPLHVFKKVVAISRVAKKLKGGHGYKSHLLFFDEDLLSPTVVNENIAFKEVESEEASPQRFKKDSRETSQHTMQDLRMRFLVMEGKDSAVALSLEEGNIQRALIINVDTYSERIPDLLKRPVTLGITGQNLYFCCTTEEGITKLRLIEVNIKEKEKMDELLPFVFYCSQSERDRRSDASFKTFEPAAFPDYVLCTSQSDRGELQIRPKTDQNVLIDFTLSPEFS